MTFVRNCPSCATEVLGADSGAEFVESEDLDGIDDVVVAADPAWSPAAAINATANRTQAEATNRRGLHPAAATSPALQISSRRVVPRQLSHRKTESGGLVQAGVQLTALSRSRHYCSKRSATVVTSGRTERMRRLDVDGRFGRFPLAW